MKAGGKGRGEKVLDRSRPCGTDVGMWRYCADESICEVAEGVVGSSGACGGGLEGPAFEDGRAVLDCYGGDIEVLGRGLGDEG